MLQIVCKVLDSDVRIANVFNGPMAKQYNPDRGHLRLIHWLGSERLGQDPAACRSIAVLQDAISHSLHTEQNSLDLYLPDKVSRVELHVCTTRGLPRMEWCVTHTFLGRAVNP